MSRSAVAVVDDELVDTDERYTPESVLLVVRAVGRIGLDPCTTRDNRTGARVFFTAREDGLAKRWAGVCREGELAFVNSPYSRGMLVQWARKVIDSWQQHSTEAIMLTPCDLGTKWATMLTANAHALAGWRGRIPFVKPDGSYDTGAKQPSNFWYFGERAARFERVFSPLANVIRLPGARP